MTLQIENVDTGTKYYFDIPKEAMNELMDKMIEVIKSTIKKELSIQMDKDGVLRGGRNMILNKEI